ncbi:hypothetical protein HY025_01880 [Candidatus Daviesbacteria bacterium]|nr:hypothetical protein [Candidatus Daviesbacteria bacterium]
MIEGRTNKILPREIILGNLRRAHDRVNEKRRELAYNIAVTGIAFTSWIVEAYAMPRIPSTLEFLSFLATGGLFGLGLANSIRRDHQLLSHRLNLAEEIIKTEFSRRDYGQLIRMEHFGHETQGMPNLKMPQPSQNFDLRRN